MEFKTISVVGLGYIGLPTAAVIASRGLKVIGLDVSEHAVKTINEGNVHIVEPDLDIVVRSVVNSGNLKATLTAEKADAFMVAVPTPFKDDYKADLSYIQSAARTIAPVLEKGNLVILESTSPVGATEEMAKWLAEARPDLSFPQQNASTSDINIAHCPERVLPGHVLRELVENDRVIGGMSPACSEKAVALYKTFVKGECLITNARTAEMAKLTENSFRDVNIAFANELSLICDKLDINVWELIKLANRHPRVNILNPGPGVGGHCIAVDPWFIVSSAPDEAKLIKQARLVNDAKPEYVFNQIIKEADEFKRPVVACFGLAFKADIDDLRESPALDIAVKLAKHEGLEVLVVEPNIDALPNVFEGSNAKLVSVEQAFEEAKVMAILVDHSEFKNVDAEKWATKVVIDSRGIV
ncbi:UDP-N-acetyl-D-mannosamine dehydrogenase [Pseudoalteromonas piratica]|uniref:UDP-N-acetyl-D-mannosaminuronic acid dehydrogenase n=1 Tax=Pseudoalteromonas piratica TaxID=1348114 RepID=A0A0A7EDE5_9GAMM|nr:UDP-N-acetyl-D-mannosamine dehydrogenase [Pseudoalteromonas piratica]AIY64594.1 UDP-N-acetyl-D-mannosaminuronic acid dehydrogenase [Pseudoalteromonas piratica]